MKLPSARIVAVACLVAGIGAGFVWFRASARPAATSQATASGERSLTGEQIRTADRLRATVNDGIARGVWSVEDQERAHAAVATLPAERAIETMRPLIVAVNTGKVRFEGRGPLF